MISLEESNLMLLRVLVTEVIFSSFGAWTSEWEEAKQENQQIQDAEKNQENHEVWLGFIQRILSL